MQLSQKERNPTVKRLSNGTPSNSKSLRQMSKDPNFKVRDTHNRLKTVAQSIGHVELFASKKSKSTPRKLKNSKQLSSHLNEEFEENQKEREFDMESDENNEEMPDLHHRDDDSKESKKDELEEEEVEKEENNPETLILDLSAMEEMEEEETMGSVDLPADQDKFEDDESEEMLEHAEGAKLTLQLEQTQHSLDDVDDNTKNHWDMTRRDELANAADRIESSKPPPDCPTGNPLPNSATDKERCCSEATQPIKEEMRKAKSVLDQTNEECKLLFTPEHTKQATHARTAILTI
jgi:hypothetical protein